MPRTTDHGPRTNSGFTLIELLIAMAITLVMIGAVVTLFANISNSVRNRRAVVEMSGQLRHARNMLQQDLQGATCPGLPWQRPDENQGYIEIIEGSAREGNASVLIDAKPNASPAENWPPTALNPEIDHRTSILPSSNLPLASTGWATDGASLGDYDDILMFTSRNEHEPFVGRMPTNVRIDDEDAARFDVNPNSPTWSDEAIQSPLAEVVWYAVENPGFDDDAFVDQYDGFFGEPGMRTIYRRTLLIAPWVNPYRFTSLNGTVDDTFQIVGDSATFTAVPGLLRILPDGVERDDVHEALACLIAFQERYDLSVRLEFDPLLDPSNGGRWKIVANTLGDLTKRENRYEHHFYRPQDQREYPFAVASIGSGYQGRNVNVVTDPELGGPAPFRAAQANLTNSAGFNDIVGSYTIEPDNLTDAGRQRSVRPFAYVDEDGTSVATARAMLNDDGEVVRVVHGLVPLSGSRRGEDVMLTDALGFDLRVYDPGAILYGVLTNPSTPNSPLDLILDPSDPAWGVAYEADETDNDIGDSAVYPFVGQGAFVNLGYGFQHNLPQFLSGSAIYPWFFEARALGDVYGNQLAPGYAIYDTWSFHYENNGLNEDHDEVQAGVWDNDLTPGPTSIPQIDEGTNGLDDVGSYADGFVPSPTNPRLGPDDSGELETSPPYDKPLRGVQVVLRLYERDSRQVRQVTVNQHFVPE